MPSERIPFTNAQEPGASPLSGASPIAMNVVIDSRGAIRRRPCLKTTTLGPLFSDGSAPKPVVGLHRSAGGAYYAVTGDIPGAVGIWRVIDSGSVNLSIGTGGTSGVSRPVFAETEAILAIATGLTIRKIILDNDEHTALANAPYASHVIANSSRLLANNTILNKGRVSYSAPAAGSSYAGHEQWDAIITALGASGFFSAEARPDPVVALGENSADVFAFGTSSFQTFAPDANAELVYSSGVTREFGIGAINSLIRDDQSFAFLDDRRRIVHTDGRSVSILSEELKPIFDLMPVVSDCFGYRVVSGPVDALCFCFPSDGRTFAYQRGGGWATWMGWDADAANWSPFPVTAHTLTGSVNLVGLSDGSLAELDINTNTDLGNLVPAHIVTGYLDRGTDSRKHCRAVRIVLKRGATTGQGEPIARLSYRDDGGTWSEPLNVSLGESGDTTLVVHFRSLGVYRRRQWRFDFDETEELVLASATEDFEVLEA